MILTHIRTELELDRTRLLGIGLLFLFMALTSVVTQMFMSEILALSGLQIVVMEDPSIEMILVDFWGDVVILAMILILFTMSTFSSELDVNKSGYFYLARPISRRMYFLTRFWIRVFGTMILFFLSSMITYLYATLFFEPLELGDIMLSALLLSLALGSVVALVIAASATFSGNTAGVVGLMFVFTQLIIGLVEPLKWLSPLALAGIWESILTSSAESQEVLSHLLVLVAWLLVPCIAGLRVYLHRDLN